MVIKNNLYHYKRWFKYGERFKREGVNIPYSTISDWVSNTCRLIAPLYDALKKPVLASDYLHADDTPIKVLDRDKKRETHRAKGNMARWAEKHRNISGPNTSNPYPNKLKTD